MRKSIGISVVCLATLVFGNGADAADINTTIVIGPGFCPVFNPAVAKYAAGDVLKATNNTNSPVLIYLANKANYDFDRPGDFISVIRVEANATSNITLPAGVKAIPITVAPSVAGQGSVAGTCDYAVMEVPAISTWGALTLILLLLTGGTIVLVRHPARVAV